MAEQFSFDVVSEVDMQEMKNVVDQSTKEIKQRFEGSKLEGEIQGWGLPLGSERRTLTGDNFILTGDAGSLIDPFTGEGIGNALLSGMYAAETISNATSPAWNGTFAWDSKFRLIFSYDKKKLTVRIKLHSNATAAEKGTWKAAVEGKWSNQKKLEVIEDIAKPKKKDLYR